MFCLEAADCTDSGTGHGVGKVLGIDCHAILPADDADHTAECCSHHSPPNIHHCTHCAVNDTPVAVCEVAAEVVPSDGVDRSH